MTRQSEVEWVGWNRKEVLVVFTSKCGGLLGRILISRRTMRGQSELVWWDATKVGFILFTSTFGVPSTWLYPAWVGELSKNRFLCLSYFSRQRTACSWWRHYTFGMGEALVSRHMFNGCRLGLWEKQIVSPPLTTSIEAFTILGYLLRLFTTLILSSPGQVLAKEGVNCSIT